ncbi:site-specific integrase [Streptomyces sp. NPDC050256]|uniref:site-specific integrase n=1 Tax=Streptomyces sp. NPDC050256 TaxID=3365607 RepID=UPI0037B6AB31
MVATSQSAQITVAGDPLEWRPHDFRRIFVTDAIRSGLPPHIAAKICGHAALDTTMGYAAIYPEDVISHHRAFIARRRTERPSDEYRELTPPSGTSSWPTSNSARSPWGPAAATTRPRASMKTPVPGPPTPRGPSPDATPPGDPRQPRRPPPRGQGVGLARRGRRHRDHHGRRHAEAGGHARACNSAVHRSPRHARHPPRHRTQQRRR